MSQIIKTTATKAPAASVKQMLEQNKAQIAAALPAHLKPDRMLRIALTEINKNPELANCDPVSFCGAIVQCSQLGLEPGNALGHAYLIPFWNKKRGIQEVQLIPGYRGLIDLARRSGQILSISARVVHENDIFDYAYGLNEKLEHVPGRGERGAITYAYAVAKLKDGGHQFEVMSTEDINLIAKDSNPIWKSHYGEMARKTLVRRLFKYLPISVEIATVIDLSDTEEKGLSQNNAQLLTDHGVKWEEPVGPTPTQIGAELKSESLETQRLEVFNRLENIIKERYKTPESIIELENELGLGLAQVAELPTESLLAIIKLVRK